MATRTLSKLSRVPWQYALEVKAMALHTLKDRSMLESLDAFFTLGTQEGWFVAHEGNVHRAAIAKRQIMLAEIMHSDPVYMSEEVFDHLNTQYLTPSLTGQNSFGILGEGSLGYRSVLMNMKCPSLEDYPIAPGLIVFPSPVVLRAPDTKAINAAFVPAIAIIAMGYMEVQSSIHPEDSGIETVLFVDPVFSNVMPSRTDLLPCLINPYWRQGSTFEWSLRLIRNTEMLGTSMSPTGVRASNIAGWSRMMMMGFLNYTRERIQSSEPVEITKPMRRFARALDLEPKVQIMQWRRVNHAPPEPLHTPAEVEWSCRWDVREHKRTYNRGTASERTIIIKSYEKGPPDKPKKLPNVLVHAAVR